MNMSNLQKKGIILLSGGLDSVVSLAVLKEEINIKLALTFNYGQKSFKNELAASKRIADFYNLEHEVINLDWLYKISSSSLTTNSKLPTVKQEDLDNIKETKKSANSVWVPNRNALFLNIAAAFCDSYGYEYILYGANKEEGETFPDNTETFRASVTEVFKTSTLIHPQVIAPLINCNKDDIVKIAVEDEIPLEYTRSCYNSNEKHCGKCESCLHLKKALLNNNCYNYINILFGENENQVY